MNTLIKCPCCGGSLERTVIFGSNYRDDCRDSVALVCTSCDYSYDVVALDTNHTNFVVCGSKCNDCIGYFGLGDLFDVEHVECSCCCNCSSFKRRS